MHGLQEGHRDQNRPGNLHQNESTAQKCVVLFCFYLPFTLTSPFMKKAFVALRRERQTQNINNLFSDHSQSTPEHLHKTLHQLPQAAAAMHRRPPFRRKRHCAAGAASWSCGAGEKRGRASHDRLNLKKIWTGRVSAGTLPVHFLREKRF